jgi:hypothetical protein
LSHTGSNKVTATEYQIRGSDPRLDHGRIEMFEPLAMHM